MNSLPSALLAAFFAWLFPAVGQAAEVRPTSGLTLAFQEPHWLTIRGPHLPSGEIGINYLEAYCRPGSTDADWVQHTVIPHRAELLSLSPDGTALHLRDTLADGVTVEHRVVARLDEVEFRLTAHNPTATRSDAHWAQACVRLAAFTGFDPNGRDLDDYLPKCFIFLAGKLTRLSEVQPWAKEARYTPGQVWCPPGIPRSDVNPRPLSALVPDHGLIGAFSGDERLVFATAWEPYQELFQGVARCLHSDLRLGGLAPGETKRARGKIYLLPNDVPALLARYAQDFPEHQPAAPATDAGGTSMTNPALRFSVPEKGYVVLRRGEVEAVVVDNRAVNDAVLPGHAAGYHGLGALRHARQSRSLFVPTYAGLNFEHIHDGTVQSREILFEPRRAPMELRVLDASTAELYQPPTPHWGLESCLRYALLPDGVVEMTFECIPRRDRFRNGYIGLFWASYIDRPESLDIHFRGVSEESAGPPGWQRGVTPVHGQLATHRAIEDQRVFPHDAAFPLELPFGFSRQRYIESWYFGVCRGMAFLQVFRPEDRVWLSQSPSGGGAGCPAWDFQWFIPEPQIGARYRLRMRAAYLALDRPNDPGAVREQVGRVCRSR
jgi:hypothetical protein